MMTKKIKPKTQKAKLELIEQTIKEILKENQQLKQENSKLKELSLSNSKQALARPTTR